MIDWLIKHFIKDSENTADPEVRRKYGTLCSIYGIFLNVLLFAGKYFAGMLSGSVAIAADAFNNLSDAASSIITLLGFSIAAKKPDSEHPFGHGRAEYLTGLMLSALIIVMGFELGKASVEKIVSPSPVESSLLSAAILVFSILVKFYMSLYNKKIGKKINSAAMQATAVDSLSDTVSTLVVLLSMGVAALFKVNVDGYAGLAVAVFICYAGYSAAKDTVSPLLGNPPKPEFVKEVEEIVMSNPEIIGIHDLIVHDYGPGRVIVSLHAEVNGKGDLFILHDMIDRAENALKDKLGCIATIHLDPIETDNPAVADMRAKVTALLKSEMDSAVSIHDFRMVSGPTHTNLIFDVLLPSDWRGSDEDAAAKVKSLITSKFENCYAVVSIDGAYV